MLDDLGGWFTESFDTVVRSAYRWCVAQCSDVPSTGYR